MDLVSLPLLFGLRGEQMPPKRGVSPWAVGNTVSTIGQLQNVPVIQSTGPLPLGPAGQYVDTLHTYKTCPAGSALTSCGARGDLNNCPGQACGYFDCNPLTDD